MFLHQKHCVTKLYSTQLRRRLLLIKKCFNKRTNKQTQQKHFLVYRRYAICGNHLYSKESRAVSNTLQLQGTVVKLVITLSAKFVFPGLARERAWKVVHIDYQVEEQMYYNPGHYKFCWLQKVYSAYFSFVQGRQLLRTVCSTSYNPIMLREGLHDFLTRMTVPVQISARASAEAAGLVHKMTCSYDHHVILS